MSRFLLVTSGTAGNACSDQPAGLKEAEVDRSPASSADAVSDFEGKAETIRRGVSEICARYPLYE